VPIISNRLAIYTGHGFLDGSGVMAFVVLVCAFDVVDNNDSESMAQLAASVFFKHQYVVFLSRPRRLCTDYSQLAESAKTNSANK
jgi:hypothetical protein